MKANRKKIICLILAAAITLSVISVVPSKTVSAKESVGNGLVLSTDGITVTPNTPAAFTAVLGEGFDATRLAVVTTDPNAVTITPIAYAANAAAFQVTYLNSGSTVAAVYNVDNPAIVAYINISASPVIMEIPAKLGTNRSNYCILTGYEFVPYDFTYADFHDYQCTLNITYRCEAYNDDDYNHWGCYGYFYDAAGNVLSKVHLYGSSLLKDRTYHSEFNVPVNAVRFSIEGFY